MTVLLYVLGSLIIFVLIVILVITSLPSPTITQLLKRFSGRRSRQ